MPEHVPKEQARILQVLDDLAGDDRVEPTLEVHRSDISALRVVAHPGEQLYADTVNVDPNGAWVDLGDTTKQGIGFSL